MLNLDSCFSAFLPRWEMALNVLACDQLNPFCRPATVWEGYPASITPVHAVTQVPWQTMIAFFGQYVDDHWPLLLIYLSHEDNLKRMLQCLNRAHTGTGGPPLLSKTIHLRAEADIYLGRGHVLCSKTHLTSV